MASNDLFLRSDAQKGEGDGPFSPEHDVRLRSDADKVAGAITRTATDGLFLLSGDTRERINPILDAVLLLDRDYRIQQNTSSDNLLLDDTTRLLRGFTRLGSDAVLLVDAVRKTRRSVASDNLLLLENQYLARRSVVRDSLLLLDFATQLRELLRLDTLLLRDSAETVVIGQAIIRSVTDGLLMLDETLRGLEKTETVTLLLGDDVAREIVTEVARLVSDNLLLFDQAFTSLAKPRSVTDTLLLQDRIREAHEKRLRDDLLINDFVKQIREALIREGLLLDVSSIVRAGKIVIARDGLLFSEQRFSELDRRIAETLLIGDAIYRTIEKIQAENLLLLETAPALVIKVRSVTDELLLLDEAIRRADLDRSITDSLLLRDTRFSQLLRRLLDSVLLGDAARAQRLPFRRLLDDLLLSDATQKTYEKFVTDPLLLGSAAQLLRSLLRRDDALISDSVLRIIAEAFIQALVFAELDAVDLMGITVSAQANLLGVELDSNSNLFSFTIDHEFPGRLFS